MLLANVHDALLIEDDADRIDQTADLVETLMVRAGRELLGGLVLRVDRQVVRRGERMLEDQQDRERWNWLTGRLERLERWSAGATGGVAPALQRLFSYLSFVSFVAAQLVGVFMSGSDDASPYIHEPSFANGRTQFRPTLKQSTGQRGYVNVPVDWLH